MKNLLIKFLERIAKNLRATEEAIVEVPPTLPEVINEVLPSKTEKKKELGKKQKTVDVIPFDPRNVRDIRDVMALMEVPFVALSKNRTAPILYQTPDRKSRIKISCHPPHYVASIYDWDIILLVSSKLQEIMNSNSDIPPRTLIIPRHELLKEIHRHDGKKQEKDLKASLSRLNSTLIETTICNQDGKYEAGFGFLDSWGYTDRKDVKEFRITLSQWLYDITCQKGSLLKVNPKYFKMSSALKRFLYRTARKHVGTQNESWTFSIEALYEKSGSEREIKKFKHDLKKCVQDNDIPDYSLEWVEEGEKTYIRFTSQQRNPQKSLHNGSKKSSQKMVSKE